VGKQATTKHMDGGILKLVKLRWEPTLQPRMNTKGNQRNNNTWRQQRTPDSGP
jgi:hypothetical protein